MTSTDALLRLQLSDDQLRREAVRLRARAALDRPSAAGTWTRWGVAQVLDTADVQPPRALQRGELVLIAPAADPEDSVRVVHSKVRGGSLVIPEAAVRVLLDPLPPDPG